MEIGGLYQLVLILVLVGVVAGTGIVALDKMADVAEAMAPATNRSIDAINNASAAIGDIPKTWLGLIVVVAVMAIVITLIIRSFAGQKSR